jgi:hypothetical protein
MKCSISKLQLEKRIFWICQILEKKSENKRQHISYLKLHPQRNLEQTKFGRMLASMQFPWYLISYLRHLYHMFLLTTGGVRGFAESVGEGSYEYHIRFRLEFSDIL